MQTKKNTAIDAIDRKILEIFILFQYSNVLLRKVKKAFKICRITRNNKHTSPAICPLLKNKLFLFNNLLLIINSYPSNAFLFFYNLYTCSLYHTCQAFSIPIKNLRN